MFDEFAIFHREYVGETLGSCLIYHKNAKLTKNCFGELPYSLRQKLWFVLNYDIPQKKKEPCAMYESSPIRVSFADRDYTTFL